MAWALPKDELKEMKRRFRNWRAKNKEAELTLEFDKALKLPTGSAKSARMEELLMVFAERIARLGQVGERFVREQGRRVSSSMTTRELSYVEACVRFGIDAFGGDASSAKLEKLVKLGVVTRRKMSAAEQKKVKDADVKEEGALWKYHVQEKAHVDEKSSSETAALVVTTDLEKATAEEKKASICLKTRRMPCYGSSLGRLDQPTDRPQAARPTGRPTCRPIGRPAD